MKKRPFGATGFSIAPLAFGGNVFGWTADQATSFELLDAFVAGGFNLIDTADVYSSWVPGNKGGESERILGAWLRKSGKRGQIVLSTKVGLEMPAGKGLGRAHVMKAVEDSLQRLGTDHIDLYFSHRDDPSVPLAETLGVYAELIKQGKVRAIGASNYTGDRLREALLVSKKEKLPSYSVVQPLYNLYDREDYERTLEPLCQEHGLGVIPYFSLASGFLTGKYRTEADAKGRARSERVKGYFNPRGFKLLKALDQVAEARHSTPAAVALAWLMQRPSIAAPIASATSVAQLNDLMAAAALVLTPKDLEELEG